MDPEMEKIDLSEIVKLNVGGQLFTTTKQTLLSVDDSFFTAMFSGCLPILYDSSGAIFIDRSPDLFTIILNYLRTNHVHNVDDSNIEMLRHEAEFYSITPLVKQLKLYENLVTKPTCGGDILFQSLLKTNQSNDLIKPKSQVKQIVPFDNGLVIVFNHYVDCYLLSEYDGWHCVFESRYFANEIKFVDFHFESTMPLRFMLAICEKEIVLWSTCRNSVLSAQEISFNQSLYFRSRQHISVMQEIEEIGRFSLNDYPIDSIFFIGSQLVALNKEKGRVGIWNSSRRWFVQDLKPNTPNSVITAFDKTESDYLFLCSNHGTIYLIDMQKFPLRLKDGDLLINKFYKDPENEEITSISCFVCCPQNEYCNGFNVGKSIEIAYGTRSGNVRYLVHRPETVGQGPQLFQTIKVHLCSISRIMLTEKYLITMCEQLHVRTWSLVRFRGLILNQPGTKTHSSFKVHRFDEVGPDQVDSEATINVGPYGHQRDGQTQVFIEMPKKNSNYINILYAANGQKICSIKSVDDSVMTSVCSMSQVGFQNRQFIITGHKNGTVQIWDLTTAMEIEPKRNQIAYREISKPQLIKEIFQNN